MIARKLRQDGIGASVKHTPIVTHEEEASLWSQGVMGTKTPKSLFNAVSLMNGKILCLRGGREHKDLKVAQLTFGEDSGGEFVVYTENGSKNRSGSYKNSGDNKIVKQYAVPELGEKCYVYLLKLYYSKLPAKLLKDPESVFYWKPKDKVPMATNAP